MENKKIKTFESFLMEDLDINAAYRAMKEREYDADQRRREEEQKFDAAKSPQDIIKKIIHRSDFLNKNVDKLIVNEEYIEYKNDGITRKYLRIWYDYNESTKFFTLEARFNGDISDDVYVFSLWKKWMKKEYINPKYAHEDTEVKIISNSENRIGNFLEDVVKSYIIKGW